jgi:hypothetical protein
MIVMAMVSLEKAPCPAHRHAAGCVVGASRFIAGSRRLAVLPCMMPAGIRDWRAHIFHGCW